MEKSKRFKGINSGTIHGDISESAAYNAINFLIKALCKEDVNDVDFVLERKDDME
jgi:hypothetical protein